MPNPKIIEFPLGDAYNLQYHFKQIEVNSAAILQLNSVPKVLIAAPGAGFILMPIHAIAKLNYGTVAYDGTNNDPEIKINGASTYLMLFTDLLSQGSDFRMFRTIRTIDIDQPENAAIILTEDVDPVNGDGTLTIYLWYILLEL